MDSVILNGSFLQVEELNPLCITDTVALFGTTPHEKLSRGFSLLTPVCIIPQSRPKRQ